MSRRKQRIEDIIEKEEDPSLSELKNRDSQLKQKSLYKGDLEGAATPTYRFGNENSPGGQNALKVEPKKHQLSYRFDITQPIVPFNSAVRQSTNDKIYVAPGFPQNSSKFPKPGNRIQQINQISVEVDDVLAVLKSLNTPLYEISMEPQQNQDQLYSVRHVASCEQIANCAFSSNRFKYTQLDITLDMKIEEKSGQTYFYKLKKLQQRSNTLQSQYEPSKEKIKLIAQFAHRQIANHTTMDTRKAFQPLKVVESVCYWSHQAYRSKVVKYNPTFQVSYISSKQIDLSKTTPSMLSTVIENQKHEEQFVIFEKKGRVYVASSMKDVPIYVTLCFGISRVHHKLLCCRK